MQDPLNINIPLGGVETKLPVLPEQDVKLQVTKSSVDPNKDGNGLNWNIVANTTEVITAQDGREVKPNFPLYHICALQAREDSKDPDAFRRSIAETIDAIFGTNKDTRPDFSRDVVNEAVGKSVIAHVYPDEFPKGSGAFSTKIRRMKAVS